MKTILTIGHFAVIFLFSTHHYAVQDRITGVIHECQSKLQAIEDALIYQSVDRR